MSNNQTSRFFIMVFGIVCLWVGGYLRGIKDAKVQCIEYLEESIEEDRSETNQ